MWKAIGEAHGWEHPGAPAIKWLWKEKSAEAVLEIFTDARIRYISTRRALPEERLRDEMAGSGVEGEEGRPGPPNM